MEARRKYFLNKLKDDIRTLKRNIEMNKKSIENINSSMSAGKDLDFFRNRIEQTSRTIQFAEEKILALQQKMEGVPGGMSDKEINELFAKTQERIDEKTEKRQAQNSMTMEQKLENESRGYQFDSRDRREAKQEAYKIRDMNNQYERFLNVVDTLPDHISRNLPSMPNNKGYRWRGVVFFGHLPEEPGPVVIFDKSQEGMRITETTATSEVVWLKGRDQQQKKLISSTKRRLNLRAPATVY